jgi:large-conductance mechanosensitive channel
MPNITFFLPGGAWRKAVRVLSLIQLGVGSSLAAIIDFLIIALIIFVIMKQLEKHP